MPTTDKPGAGFVRLLNLIDIITLLYSKGVGVSWVGWDSKGAMI